MEELRNKISTTYKKQIAKCQKSFITNNDFKCKRIKF